MIELRSHLGRIRGLGSSNEGVNHWWSQRISGIALIPLIIWFLISAHHIFGSDLGEFKVWLGANANPVLLSLLIYASLYHGQMGLQVVIEDYIHLPFLKYALILFSKFTAIVFGGYSIFVIIRLSTGV